MKHFFLTASAFLASVLAFSTVKASPIVSSANVFGERLVNQITEGSKVISFDYNEENQLTGVTTKSPYATSTATFSYEGGTYNGTPYDMTVEINDPRENIVCFLSIGDNGFVSKSVEIEISDGEIAEYQTYLYEYDDEGHLVKVMESGIFYNETVSLEYVGGDIVTATKVDDEVERFNVAYTSPTVPVAMKNVGKMMNFDAFGIDNFENTYFYYAGLLGQPTKHLPVASVETDKDGSDTTYFDWTLDADGYPIQFKEYEDNKLEDVFSFSWANTSALAFVEPDNTSVDVAAYYDINGVRHNIAVKGLNIQKNADGTASKVLVR